MEILNQLASGYVSGHLRLFCITSGHISSNDFTILCLIVFKLNFDSSTDVIIGLGCFFIRKFSEAIWSFKDLGVANYERIKVLVFKLFLVG